MISFPFMQESCEKHLFQSLHILVGCIPLEMLKAFLGGQLVGLFQHSNTHFTHCVTALYGLRLAAQVPDPAQGVVNLLNETARKIFASLPFDKVHVLATLLRLKHIKGIVEFCFQTANAFKVHGYCSYFYL